MFPSFTPRLSNHIDFSKDCRIQFFFHDPLSSVSCLGRCPASVATPWCYTDYSIATIFFYEASDHVIPLLRVLGKSILFPLKNLHNSPPLSWSTSLTSHPTSFLQALLSRHVSFHLLLELSRQALASASPISLECLSTSLWPALPPSKLLLSSLGSSFWSSSPSVFYYCIPGFPDSHFLSTLHSLLR